MKTRLLLLLLTVMVLGSNLRTPKEIYEIGEKSSIIYSMQPLKEEVKPTSDPLVLPPHTFLNKEGKLVTAEYSPDIEQALADAKKIMLQHQYTEAFSRYKKIYKDNNEIIEALVGAAHCAFLDGKLKKAKKLFKKAIKKDFHNYQAHWFLATTYYQLGDLHKANIEIINAHLLNRNHPLIKGQLIDISKQVKSWNDWKFIPQVDIKKELDSIIVYHNDEWLGWAMATAIWENEPNYQDHYSDPDFLVKYKEALLCYLTFMDEPKSYQANMVKLIIDKASFITPFILYELILPQNPEFLHHLNSEIFEPLYWYIRIHHQRDIEFK